MPPNVAQDLRTGLVGWLLFTAQYSAGKDWAIEFNAC